MSIGTLLKATTAAAGVTTAFLVAPRIITDLRWRIMMQTSDGADDVRSGYPSAPTHLGAQAISISGAHNSVSRDAEARADDGEPKSTGDRLTMSRAG